MSWGWGEFQKIPPKTKHGNNFVKEANKNESTEQNRKRIQKPKTKH